MHAQSELAGYSSIGLQLAVLRNLPTPVVVLSPARKASFANRAAERLVGSPDPIQSPGRGILDQGPAELGIKLLYNRIWNVVLDKLVSVQKQASSEGKEQPVHEVDIMVLNSSLTKRDISGYLFDIDG